MAARLALNCFLLRRPRSPLTCLSANFQDAAVFYMWSEGSAAMLDSTDPELLDAAVPGDVVLTWLRRCWAFLIDQPIEREFKPAFGTGDNTPIWKLSGHAKAGREIYFALYQQLADSGEDPNGMFREFAPDLFDLVIVDECHRGSARAESSWRAILDYFSPATQLGMTATPKRDETVDSYEYFGDPLYEYSLAQGIDDGFLAP